MLLIGRPNILRVFHYVPKLNRRKFLSSGQRVYGAQNIELCVESGMEMWNGLRGTAYNHSRTARNVGVLFTNLVCPIVWKSKDMD